MSFETLELTRNGPVGRITLNRPDRLNAINKTMLDELCTAMDALEQDEDIYAIVLSANGRAFCAGFDLKASLETKRTTEQEWRQSLEYDLDVIMRFWHSPKPTIAAVQGYCLAAGFELALACDMTVCTESALFGEPELRFGSSIVALLLPWYTNPKRAKKLLLTGQDRMSASDALDLGIVNEVVNDDQLTDRSESLAREAALMDPDSVRMTKQAINRTYEIMGLHNALSMGVEISIKIETLETDLRKEFNRILAQDGMKAALAWREDRLNN